MAGSERSTQSPRPAKSTPSSANSGSTWPAPTPAIARPPDSASSVPNALATSSGWWYGRATTWLSSRTRSVAAARKPSVTNGWYQVVPIFSSKGLGMATCSHTPT